MNLLSLDVGTNNIGIAAYIANQNVIVALEKIVYKKNNFDLCFTELRKVIRSYKISKIIIGNPKDYQTSNSYIVQYISLFLKLITKEFNNIEFILFSEYFSTQLAISRLKIKYMNNKDKINKWKDSESAKIILESFLKNTK